MSFWPRSGGFSMASKNVVRSGLVFTKGQKEDGLFGRASWKLRYVELMSDGVLNYYASQGGVFTGQVDLRQCHAMEMMPSDCPHSGNRLTSVYRIALKTTDQRRIVLAALSERGMNMWAMALKSFEGPNLGKKSPKASNRVSLFRRVLRAL
ncbi:unnamed protein product [Aphanomyces euteiches]